MSRSAIDSRRATLMWGSWGWLSSCPCAPSLLSCALSLRRPLSLLLLILLAAVAAPAVAAPRDSLAQAGRQYLDQEYEQVIRILAPLSADLDLAVPLRISVHELMGLSYLIMGDQRRARQAFETVLGLEPDHLLRDPSDSPKLRSFFDSIKLSFVSAARRAQLELRHRPPARARAGDSVELRGNFTRGRVDEVSAAELHWRQLGTSSFHHLPMTFEGRELSCSFLLPSAASAYELEYYLEVRDDQGRLLKRTGSADRPLVLRVAVAAQGGGGRSGSIWGKWWLWTGIAVVAGGVTTAAILLTRDSAPVGNLGPGKVDLQ